MENDCSWLDSYRAERQRGLRARQEGNEGMARVCARRAAGVVVQAYFASRGLQKSRGSSLYNLRALARSQDVPVFARGLAEHFIAQISPEHILPGDVDLLEEVERLRAALLPEC
jgi:hypothetical protein